MDSQEGDESSAPAGLQSARMGSPSFLDQSDWSPLRKWAYQFCTNRVVENTMAALITLNVALMVWEVDLRANCRFSTDTENTEDKVCNVPLSVWIINTTILMIYVVEIAIRVFAYRKDFFFKLWNYANAFVVFVGLVDLALSAEENRNVPNLTVLRLFRLFKLFRTINLMVYFPELYELLRGFAGAVYAMLWGSVLIFIMLAVWSMLAVEIMPTPKEMWDQYIRDQPPDPPESLVHPLPESCHEVFSSILSAMLFFFQTLVAGDSWGQCTIPIIKQQFATVFVFLGALVCIELGVTNLILAVIVDAAAGAREKDQEQKLRKKMQYEKAGLERWRAMVAEIDTDGSGTISLQELIAGFDTHAEVRQCFQLLDVDHRDLHDFFFLLDHDNSGALSYSEFFHDLQKAHTQDTRMYLMSLKLQVSHIAHLLKEQVGQLQAGAGTGAVAPSTPASTTPKSVQAPTILPAPKYSVSDNGASDQFFAKLQAQLDQLTQSASAQAAMLVQNTKMLEALLASCDVEDPSKFGSGGRQESGAQGGANDPSESQQFGFGGGFGRNTPSGTQGGARGGRRPGRVLGRAKSGGRNMTGSV